MPDPKNMTVYTQTVLAAALIILFSATIVALFAVGLPQDAGTSTALGTLIGIIAGRFGQLFDYIFGSSKGSADKQDVITRQQDTLTTIASTAVAPVDPTKTN